MFYSDVNVDIQFTLNQPQTCGSHSSILLLVVIHSTFGGYDKRAAIRKTWGSQKNSDDLIPVVFFLPPPNSENPPEIQASLQRESHLHKNIIQGNYKSEDSFTTKMVTASVWMKKYCSQAAYILSVEDVSVVDMYKLVPYLKSLSYSWKPVFLCDYITPDEMTVLTKKEKHKPYCPTSAFLTTAPIVSRIANTLYNSQDTLKDAWLSELADAASVEWINTSKFFTGTRQNPSVLNEFASSNYGRNSVMIGLITNVLEGREATMIHRIWSLIQERRLYTENQEQMQNPDGRSESNIVVFAVGFMLVDFFIVALIFILIFYHKRRKVKR